MNSERVGSFTRKRRERRASEQYRRSSFPAIAVDVGLIGGELLRGFFVTFSLRYGKSVNFRFHFMDDECIKLIVARLLEVVGRVKIQ